MAEPKSQNAHPHYVNVTGRISNVRRTTAQDGTVFVHLVKLPAKDEFSSPKTLRITSKERVGDEGDKFDRLCEFGGYGRSYQTQDDETGRKTTVPTADNTWTVVG